jgi:KDO2-lipid IV(A) lauroyltransferase
MSLLEMGALWFVPREQLWARMRIEGHEHLDAARTSGNGVILLQAHFTTLELCGNLLGAEIGMDANYDDPNNALYAAWLRAQRERFLDETIHNRNIRRMVRRLKSGHTVWFSPDQWVRGSRGGLLTQYFGRDVFTSPGTARIAAMTGAQVVPFLPVREANGRYCLKLFPALIDFPSGDLAADTQRINALFESQIRAYPAQYLWLHKRFKRVGPEQPDLYA